MVMNRSKHTMKISAAWLAVGLSLGAGAQAQSFTYVPLPGTHNIQTNLINTFPTGAFIANNTLATPFNISSAPGNCGPAKNAPCNYFDGFAAAGTNLTLDVSVAGATDVYTLMNAYSPPPGQKIATIQFVGSAGASVTFPLIGGQDIRDYNQSIFVNTLTNGIPGVEALNAFSCHDPTTCLGSGGTGNVQTGGHNNYVIDEQHYSLGSTFAGQTLTKIIITDTHTGSTPAVLGVTVESGSPAAAAPTAVLPQLAFGGGWYTALYFTNLTDSPVSFPVNFVAEDGAPLSIAALGGSSVTVNLAARGTVIIEAPNTGPLVEGYAAAALPTGVTGYGVFRYTAPGSAAGQEAVVPLSGVSATTSTLIFDETSYTTGVAVVGLGAAGVTVNVTAYNSQGKTLGTGSIQLAANGKTAVLLKDIPGLSGVVGQRGSVDFTVSSGNVAVLGIRTNGLAFTSIPTSDK